MRIYTFITDDARQGGYRVNYILSRLFDIPVTLFSAGFMLGGLICGYAEGEYAVIFKLTFCILLLLAGPMLFIGRLRNLIFVLIGIMAVLPIMLGWFHSEAKLKSLIDSRFLAEELEIEGYISREPQIRRNSTRLIIKVDSIKFSNGGSSNISADQSMIGGEEDSIQQLRKLNFELLVNDDRYEDHSLGQWCTVKGKVESPPILEEFDYREYLRNKRIFYVANYRSDVECESIATRRGGSILRNSLYDLKMSVVSIIEQGMHEPQASLLIGIILGEDRLFDEQFDENLRFTGTTHIIAASGYNVSIIVAALNRICSGYMRRRLRLIVAIALVGSFVILSGGSASIVRAGLMSGIMMIGMIVGRPTRMSILIMLSCVVFVVFDPRIIYSISLQLSIAATTGLVYLLPALETVVKIKNGFAKDLLSTYVLPTVVCTVATLPITAFYFQEITLLGVFSNLLILPVVEGSMVLGVVAVVISLISTQISSIFLMAAYLQLKYFEIIVDWLAGYQFARVRVEWFGRTETLVATGLLLLIAFQGSSSRGNCDFAKGGEYD